MSFHRLDPSIPVDTPKGPGRAIAIVDYSEDHHALWVVALDASGEVWWVRNPDIRVRANWSLGTAQGPVDEKTWAAANKGKYKKSTVAVPREFYATVYTIDENKLVDIWEVDGLGETLVYSAVQVRKS